MTETDDPLAPIIARLKEPVDVAPDLAARVMAALDDAAADPGWGEDVPAPPAWWRRRWTVRMSPLGGLAMAAGLAGLVFAGGVLGRRTAPRPVAVERGSTMHATQFVLVAPDARAVTVAGDFNDWNVTATPLTRAGGDGLWSVTVPLAPGRYRYAFMVDGAIWRGDPDAPAVEDEFGQPNSVVTIGAGGA